MVGGMLFQVPFLPAEAWNTGGLFGKPLQGLGVGYQFGMKGTLPLAVLGGAIAAATAPRGHALSATARTSGAILGTLALSAINPAFGILAGPLIGDKLIGRPIERAVQAFSELSTKAQHLNMGGDYEDTQAAYTMRQVAVREMGTSLLNARHILGREAAFMHT